VIGTEPLGSVPFTLKVTSNCVASAGAGQVPDQLLLIVASRAVIV
jgi:hypothetical protein